MSILDPAVPRAAVTLRASLSLTLTLTAAVTLAAAIEPASKAAAELGSVVSPPVVPPPAEAIITPPVQTRAVATPPRKPSPICGGDLDSSSASIHEDDGRQTWTIKLKNARCTVDFRLDGKVEFNDAFTDIASLSPNGLLRLDVTDAGVRRQLEIKSDRGTLERPWRVDGREQPYDDAARSWFADFLIELDRRTAVGVDRRLPVLLRQGGVPAVLEETALMPSDYARSVYYGKLAKATRLSNADVVRIFDQTVALKTSDYYASEVIKDLGASAEDADVRAALFRIIQKMDSDYYQSEAVAAAVGRGRLSAREIDFLIDIVPRMDSDYYKTEVLKQIVGGRLEAVQRVSLARLAKDIHEDFYAAEFIKALAAGGEMGRGGARALVDAASSIDSDFYLSESFGAILAHTTLDESDLLAVVQATRPKTSDHYKAEILTRVVRHKAVTDRVRQAVIDASAGMSSSYRDELRRAASRG